MTPAWFGGFERAARLLTAFLPVLVGCSGKIDDPSPNRVQAGTAGVAAVAGMGGAGGSVAGVSGASGSGAGTAGTASAVTCAVGQTPCGGVCATTASDNANCGTCGNACPAGSVCQGSACQVLCATGQALCAGTCKTTVSDATNCGGCNLACGANQVCATGACAADCGALQPCDGAAGTECADIMTNPRHCGGCGAACAPGLSCVAGFCVLNNCPSGLAACSGQCVDTQANAANCGACGIACPMGTPCIGGFCGCPAGQTLCDGACFDLTANAGHCGSCATPCPTGQACEASQCRIGCSGGLSLCAGSCVDVTSAPAHCGGCDQACPAAQMCTGGVCTCPSGGTLCGTTCVNTQSDAMHCGTCTMACLAEQTCTNGACACPAGRIACGAACVDTQTSADHCGGCNMPCGGGSTCSAGACVCPMGQTLCGGLCVDTNTSDAHCGECNAACSMGQACLVGVCSGAGGVGADGCTGGLARNVALSRIDAFQSVRVQIMNNGTEIAAAARNTDVVEARETVFRIFVTPGAGWTARQLSARVTVVNGATSDEYFVKKNVTAASTEGDTNSTFQVTVPGDKISATSQYHVELVECGTVPTNAATTPRFPAMGDQALGARRTGPLKVRMIPIRANGRIPDLSAAGLVPYHDMMDAMYPASSIELSTGGEVMAAYPIDWNATLDAVRAKRQADAPAADIYYYGLLAPTDTFNQFCMGGCTAGIGFVTSQNDGSRRVAIGIGFTGNQSPPTMAHEVGHNHGRNHAPCVPQGGSISGVDNNYPYMGGNIGVWGYDKRTKNLVNPMNITDIMGYCNNKWISDYNYDGLVNRVAAVNGANYVYVNPDVLSTWRILLLDAAGPRWGIPVTELEPPGGTAEVAEMLDVGGNTVEFALVYRTEVSEIDAWSIMVPEPKPSWAAVRISGQTALKFAAKP